MKTFDMSSLQATIYLSKHCNFINWTYRLQSNRLGRSLKQIGEIPYETRSRRVYYNRKDIEQVAEVIKLNYVANVPLTQLFK